MPIKTIFITISRGSIAKNILQTDVFRILKEAGHRLVVLSPAYNQKEFQETFGGTNIFFEPLYEHKWKKSDYFFVGLHKAIIYNATTELRDRFGFLARSETNACRRILKKIIFKPLSRFGFLKEFIRLLDLFFLPDRYYKEIFDKYSPNLVFIANPLEDSDSDVTKQARRRGIKIIAMPKSWDNLPKMSFRVKPDKLLVWGDSMVEHAQLYQNMRVSDVVRCGTPQFDIYADELIIWPREKFFSFIGADTAKALIVLGSEGKVTPQDPDIAEIIYSFVKDGKLEKSAQLFIRPYFSLLGEEDKFKSLLGKENVIVDKWFHRKDGFRDHWDWSREQMIFFANLMYHLDIMVTHASTLMLDAAAHDKPIIGIGFDGYKRKDFGDSTHRWFFSAHFKAVTDSGGFTVAKDANDMLEAINNYLKNPILHSEGRARMREYFCYKLDGKSGERVAGEILNFL